MPFAAPPAAAAWQHHDARLGFEVSYFQPFQPFQPSQAGSPGYHINGCTTAVEDGQSWVVSYAITVDETWATRSARITQRAASGIRRAQLEADGQGRWRVNGEPAAQLDGCLDIDLESSAMTNALPVHRMGLRAGDPHPRRPPTCGPWTSAPNGWTRTTRALPMRAAISVTTTRHLPSASRAASSTTNPGWCSTTRASPSAPPDISVAGTGLAGVRPSP